MIADNDDILIGVDAGTSLIKCVAFSVQGEILEIASTPNEYISRGDDCVEQDMQVTRENVLQTLAQLVTQLGEDASRIKSVSITGQGDGTWLVDSSGAPVSNALLWLDSRAASIATELENSANYSRLFELTGTSVNASQMRTQMLWLDRHEPDVLDRAASCFHCKDYLYFLLTGVRAADPGEAIFTFGDFSKQTYSSEVFSLLGLSHREKLLPPIINGLTDAAQVLPAICDRTGLPSTASVNLAPVDVICSALGGGLYDQGTETAMTLLGTTGIHMRYSSAGATVVLPEDKTGYTIVFPGGGYAQLQTNMSATMNIDWLVGVIAEAASFVSGAEIGKSKDDAILQQLDAAINNTKVASALYQPYISTAGERGPFFDTNARAGFVGLDQHTNLADLARAVYEGICLAARDCYDDLGEIPGEIRVSGGGSKSSSLKQILASVMNRPVRSVDREESGAAGAAMISAVQNGYYESLDSCVQQWVSPHMGALVQPIPADSEIYQKVFPVYKAHRKSQTPIWQQLAEIRQSQTAS